MSQLRMTEAEYAARQQKQSTMTPRQRLEAEAKEKAVAPTSKQRYQALGRMKPGQMNKTEERYRDEVLLPKVAAGEILWWAFEAITLKLADDLRLTVDFFILRADGGLEAVDVKGYLKGTQDDALAKLKMAADKFPWPFSMTAPKKKADGGGWEVRNF